MHKRQLLVLFFVEQNTHHYYLLWAVEATPSCLQTNGVNATTTINTRLHKIVLTQENEVGGAYGTHGRMEKRVQGFGGKGRRKETTWKTKA
jgi:hypothetical protein